MGRTAQAGSGEPGAGPVGRRGADPSPRFVTHRAGAFPVIVKALVSGARVGGGPHFLEDRPGLFAIRFGESPGGFDNARAEAFTHRHAPAGTAPGRGAVPAGPGGAGVS
ncbi:hypothetical protein GCM10009660_29440 [Catellatospora bangladeshensis]